MKKFLFVLGMLFFVVVNLFSQDRVVKEVDSFNDTFVISTPVVNVGEGLEFYFRYSSEDEQLNLMVSLDHQTYHDVNVLSYFIDFYTDLSVQFKFGNTIVPVVYEGLLSISEFFQAMPIENNFKSINFTDLVIVRFPHKVNELIENIDITISPENGKQLQEDFEAIKSRI